jgi:hypothetical protein
MADIVRAWQPNKASFQERLGVYASRWGEFLGDDPREANSAGGVFPAIWGTIAMTLIMALLVAPFGVLAALYLREYASRGPLTAAVRIAINNLAGVPSIVYGAFGLGFFCYVLGGSIDELLFRPALVADGQPTFGTGGLLWASLTLALLTRCSNVDEPALNAAAESGDAVLREVAKRFQQKVRGYDLVARLGGEEFVVVMPSLRPEQALQAAERLRESIAEEPVVLPDGQAINVTISIGLFNAKLLPTDTADSIMKKADQALYAAKRTGRNKTVTSDQLAEMENAETAA